MYSNYLVDVAKLVYIIGEIETTSNFKRLIDSSNEYRYVFIHPGINAFLNVLMNSLSMPTGKSKFSAEGGAS